MKIRMNRRQSIIFTSVYALVTLFWRFTIEPQLQGHYLISVGIGIFFVIVYWILWNKKIVNFDKPGETTETGPKSKSKSKE